MGKIRILEPPTGAATPNRLRNDWRGIEIELATAGDFRKNPPINRSFVSSLATGDRVVLKETAAKALEEAGKKRAADFLREFPSGKYLFFPRHKCQYIP